MSNTKSFQKVDGVPNLYHRAGRYYGRVSVGGKQSWRSLGTDKIREAKRMLAELQTGRVTEIRKRTEPNLHAALEDTIEFRAIRRGIDKPLSKATQAYHQELLVLAKKLLPNRRLSSLSTEEILGSIGGAQVGQSRRKAVFELVKATYKRAVEKHQIADNPLAGHVPGQVPAKDRQLPTREELENIVEAVAELYPASGKAASLTIRFLAFSGLRRGEANALAWKDVHDGEIHVAGTKTVRSRRRVQVNPPLQAVLNEIAEVYGKDGHVVPLKCVRAHLKAACEKLDIHKLTNHDLRSWFATYALQSGVDVPTVADWLGDSAEVVLRRYASIMDSHKKVAAQLLK